MANEIKPIGSTDISAIGTVVGNLMNDLRQIIDEARIHVASTANYELTMMYCILANESTATCLEMNEQHTESKLCRKWRHNCKHYTAVKVLKYETSEE